MLTTNVPTPAMCYALAMEICIGPFVQQAVSLVQCSWPKPKLKPTFVAHLHGPVLARVPDELQDARGTSGPPVCTFLAFPRGSPFQPNPYPRPALRRFGEARRNSFGQLLPSHLS
eukprot:GGOE01047662.1.p3 GENE.GGOE01047662.1~~GGOE01047662.1.p3  ORF type:complete len:115 (-),score=7.89 GGOE01047662.1:20-364(-)